VPRLQQTSRCPVQPTHFHRRRLRQFAWGALFAWVFALAAGVANACAVVAAPWAASQGHETRLHAHVTHHAAGQEIAEAADQDPVAYPHEHQPDAGKASCLKFCDDESSALSKGSGPGLEQIQAHLLIDGFKVQPVLIADARERLALERPSAQGPPLVIRLLRLTL